MYTAGGGETGTSQSKSRHKKGHMTKICLIDSDEEAIVDFVKDHVHLMTKPARGSRTRPGSVGCGSGLQAAAICQ